MDWGMANRLARVMGSDGRCFFLAVDHGYFQGPTTSLERPGQVIAPLAEYCDALFVTRGVLRACVDPGLRTPVILRVSGGTSMVGADLADEGLTTSIEDALRLNVSAVGISIFVGSTYERQTLLNLTRLVNRCERYGIPVMAVTAVGRELEERTSRYLALACRIAAELGARVVKTYWCAEGFEKVVQGCPVPVVIAGGPRCETVREVLAFVHDGLERGAIGVNLGRNVWQNPDPTAVAAALQSLIHKRASVDAAMQVFERMRSGKGKA